MNMDTSECRFNSSQDVAGTAFSVKFTTELRIATVVIISLGDGSATALTESKTTESLIFIHNGG